jgi:hypothetical protein
MYTLKVSQRGEDGGAGPSSLHQASGTLKDAKGCDGRVVPPIVDQVGFTSGNPRVEHLTGVVHLYRHILPDGEQAPGAFTVGELPVRRHMALAASPAAAHTCCCAMLL